MGTEIFFHFSKVSYKEGLDYNVEYKKEIKELMKIEIINEVLSSFFIEQYGFKYIL